MKYVITWHEREASPAEYERWRKQLLEVFKDFKMPEGCKIQQCLVRHGEFGGYMILETNTADVETDLGRILHPVHERINDHLRANFQFKIDPVVDVTNAVAAYVTS